MTITSFEIIGSVIDLVLVVAIIGLIRITWRLEQFKKGLIAHAKAAPSPPTAQLLALWEKTYNDLPDNSPKKQAYRNRLIAEGVLELDKAGNAVKVKRGN